MRCKEGSILTSLLMKGSPAKNIAPTTAANTTRGLALCLPWLLTNFPGCTAVRAMRDVQHGI